MHIKEVAKQLNTTPRSIRFYEEKGLISPVKASENEYRLFTEKDVMRLSTILALREIGVPVNAIREILENQDMSMRQYLDVQRSALFEKWIEMKDMIETIDRMLDTDKENITENIYALSQHLKAMKNIRKGWKDKWNFDKQAADYDQNIKMHGYRFNVHQDYENALAKATETIQLERGDSCLDIGIGTGNLGSRFLKEDVHVIGVDQSEEMLKRCGEKHPDIELRKGHFLALPLLDNQVEGAISSYALHHIRDEEKLLALAEMNRVVKANGQVCIVDLMFLNDQHRERVLNAFHEAGNSEAVDAINDEFYADRSALVDWFEMHNYHVETYSFNNILSMVYAVKR
ncbi:MerR family transcriptional regulator [Lentibacillus sp. Marseille-P4043]|uniref:MerR family transcriptional regulator n=1 Tax=Lentibacillus sp. Marseille-P4043 TaxID=2040293 RepID=UPI000D0BC5D5|nr:MerR family transcriptional regulator [Lentibacillus sp. Marseille-P4043]